MVSALGPTSSPEDDYYYPYGNGKPPKSRDRLTLQLFDKKGRERNISVPMANGATDVSVRDRDLRGLVDTGVSYCFMNDNRMDKRL